MTSCSYKKLRNWLNDFKVLNTALSQLHLRPTLDAATDLWFFLKNVLVFHQKIKNSIIMSSNSPPSVSVPRRSESRELNTWSHTLVHSSIPTANSGSKAIKLSISADYTFNRLLTMSAYYDRQRNVPLISTTAYPTTTVDFGLSMKFSLTR